MIAPNVFADYMRSAIRMAALSQAGVLFVMTHDSIGLGEDGPTHQPIEHLASFRAMPNILMLRPGDGIETAGAYKVMSPSLRHAVERLYPSYPAPWIFNAVVTVLGDRCGNNPALWAICVVSRPKHMRSGLLTSFETF